MKNHKDPKRPRVDARTAMARSRRDAARHLDYVARTIAAAWDIEWQTTPHEYVKATALTGAWVWPVSEEEFAAEVVIAADALGIRGVLADVITNRGQLATMRFHGAGAVDIVSDIVAARSQRAF